jgi:enterobactin synthetase component D
MRIGHTTTVVTTPLASSIGDGVWVTPPRIFGAAVHARATADFSLPDAPPPNDLARLSVKRLRELSAGRRCAAQALRDAGSSDVVVGIGPSREPEWPRGFVGSITHSSSFACAVVGRADQVRGLGLDSEPIFDEGAMRDALPLALNARERKLIEGARERELATTIFSAKESLFKCLYPRVGVFFDFEDAEVEWITEGAFGVRLQRDLSADFGRGLLLEGRHEMGDGHIHTALELSA